MGSQFLPSVIISLSVAAVSFLWYLGAFIKITFKEETIGPFKYLYKTARGPYQDVGPLFDATITYLKKMGLQNCRTAGIYYDDPASEPNPRYAVGFIVETKEQEKKFQAEEEMILKEFKLMKVQETKTACSHFPAKFQALSCMLSAMKTYPAFKEQDEFKSFKSKNVGCLEIYTDEDCATHFPQNNLAQFTPSSWMEFKCFI